mgnify:CR=1 FL=1
MVTWMVTFSKPAHTLSCLLPGQVHLHTVWWVRVGLVLVLRLEQAVERAGRQVFRRDGRKAIHPQPENRELSLHM